MTRKRRGELLIIGGNEEKHTDEPDILSLVASGAQERGGGLVVLTIATQLPEEVAADYTAVFKKLGVRRISVLDIRTREQAYAPETLEKLDSASVLFFTGGDQLRITSQLGGTPILHAIEELHDAGALIVGTSAGAAAMSETMLIGGAGNESSITNLAMAPGLGLLRGAIVDSHFAQRGRHGRLLAAVAQNPHNLGLGIDENTAISVTDDVFTVIGGGAVYVFDGASISYTSLSDQRTEGILTIHDVRLHALGHNDRYDLKAHKPLPPKS